MFYPHYLHIRQKNIVQNPLTGEFTQNSSSLQFVSECREQVNGAGKVINGADGDTITYSSVIHLPLDCPTIQVGADIEVYNDFTTSQSQLRIKGKVLRFSRDLMHCRLWV